MYKEVTIGDKTIPMLSMASVDLYYKNVFGEDPIKLQTQEMDPGDMVNFTIRMGFIMAEFAKRKERKEMMKLNENGRQFELSADTERVFRLCVQGTETERKNR